MRQFLILLVFGALFSSYFAQVSDQNSCKSINSYSFSKGDKIQLGATPDSLSAYNTFILANPMITFQLVCSAKSAKSAALQERYTSAILSDLNAYVPHPLKSVVTINANQKDPVTYDLQVVSVSAKNEYEARSVVFSTLPENNLLYRNYDNLIHLDMVGPHRKLLLQTSDSAVTILETAYPNDYTIRIGDTRIRELYLLACTIYNNDTIPLARLRYRVGNLPVPTIYLGTIPLNAPYLKLEKNMFKSMNRFFAKYPPEIPLKESFDIKKVSMRVGETPYVFEGHTLPDEVKQAIKDASEGTLVFFDEIEITHLGNLYTRMGNYCFELCDKYK